MTHVLISRTLKPLDHRLIWWLLMNQEKADGVPTGVLAGGWRQRATDDLATDKCELYKAQQRLKAAGIIEGVSRAKEIRIRGEAFS